ncbi:MAG: hypothetical protein ACK4E7_04400 [Permianibacter sp.]
MSLFKFIFVVLLMLPATCAAYVSCSNVKVSELSGATTASFHSLDRAGVVGSVVFLSVPPSSCQATSGEDLSKGVFLVIDDVSNAQSTSYELKKAWIAMLLAAKASSGTIDIHGNFTGLSVQGYGVVKPYFLRAK